MKTLGISSVSRVMVLSLCLFALSAAAQETTSQRLIPKRSIWKYLDDNTVPEAAWRASGFDDSTWPVGMGPLGFGETNHLTLLQNAMSLRPMTVYFRQFFSVTNLSDIQSLTLQLLRDDGALVYLNGQEVARQNLPAGAITHTTSALTAVGGAMKSDTSPTISQ